MKRLALLAALAASAMPAVATPTVSGPGACGIRAVDNQSFLSCVDDQPAAAVGQPDRPIEPVARVVTPLEAWRARHNIGGRALLVDIRGMAEVIRDGSPLGSDANVPYLRSRSGATDSALLRSGHPPFNPQFLQRLDDVLAESGLKHDDPVVLICRSGTLSRIAAQLLIEHGYSDVRIVAGGFVGASDQAPQSGWKRSGLPWTRDFQAGWMRVAR